VWHTHSAYHAFGLSISLMAAALLALPHLLPESVRRGKQGPSPPKLAPA
jgi:hypothetical protein